MCFLVTTNLKFVFDSWGWSAEDLFRLLPWPNPWV